MSNRKSLSLLILVLLATVVAAAAAEAAVTFTKVWPVKIRYLNGEDATFLVNVKNTGAQPWSGRVSGVIESGLDQTTPVFDDAVTVAAGEETKLEKHWKVNLGEFGHTLHAVAENADGTLAAEGREVFCVGPWYYNMGRYITFFNLRSLQTVAAAEQAKVLPWRKWYITCAEHFAGPPGAWGAMVPETEEFYTGQAAFAESQTSERALIDAAHNNGLAVMQYDVISTWGPLLEDYSRAHPDWIAYNDRGRPAGFFNMTEMDYFRAMTPENLEHMSPGAITGNVSHLQAQESALDDIIAGLKMFNFDGIRWDGHTFAKALDIYGKPTVAGDLDEANAKWVVHMKERLHAALPNVTINYNYYPQSMGEGAPLPKTYQVMGPNAYVLWESMRGRFKDSNDPLNVWEGFVQGVRDEINDFARPHGNFQHFGWYACDSPIQQNHTQAIYYALGGHWDTWTPLRYDAFSMRYGAYLWDLRFKNLDDGSSVVQVADPKDRLWWKQFVQERPREGGGRLIITHVLNKPVHERQDEFEKEAPLLQQDVPVTLTPPAGERVLRAFLLNPDAEPTDWCTEMNPAREGDAWSVVMPSVEFWSFVVWEVGK